MSRQRAALALAQASLVGVDPVLDALVARHGPARLPSPTPAERRFEELVESIAYQQLHGNAAAAIWARVVTACGGTVTPESLLDTGTDALRACGLSGAKVRSMLDLAGRAHEGELRLARIGRLHDEAVIAELVPAWGVGRWTAQMFLMFTLGRLDVWPAGDYGVRNGYGRAWGHTEMPTEKQMPELGARFAGARSLVAWYCWRAVDSAETGRT
jgi:3-methyladenine DNA glycosylase/8-oxoguanine DNA glycosylase